MTMSAACPQLRRDSVSSSMYSGSLHSTWHIGSMGSATRLLTSARHQSPSGSMPSASANAMIPRVLRSRSATSRRSSLVGAIVIVIVITPVEIIGIDPREHPVIGKAL